MASALLAFAASVSWGIGDFAGGLISRRLPVMGVTFLQHTAGFATIGVVALIVGHLNGRALAIGALGGVFSGAGVVSYYRALSIGTMSIVSPIAACGAIVTLGIAVAAGERPSRLALAGVLVALTGAVLASFQEHGRGGANRQAVLLAVVTAFMFGFQLYFLGRASDDGGPVSAIFGARAVSAALLAVLLLSLRGALDFSRPSLIGVILVTGALVAAANTLYGLSAERGLVSISSVLASLYPVTTLVLARFLLHERLNAIQFVGVAVALGGVAMAVLG